MQIPQHLSGQWTEEANIDYLCYHKRMKNPFGFEDDFESNPIVKTTTNVTKQAAGTITKQVSQQTKAAASQTTNQILDALYGPTTSAGDPQADTDLQQQQQVHPQVSQSQQSGQHPMPQTSEEQKLAEMRKKLHDEYLQKTFGGDLEGQIKQEEQKRKQQDQQEKQEEEQKKEQQMTELEEQKKNDVPLAVQQARSKSERRPGAG